MTDITAIETDPVKLREEARAWMKAMLKTVKRQTEAKEDEAISTVARWAGVPKGTIWRLKYRPPREIGTSIYNRLKLAHARYVKSPEATIAENLAALRSLPSTPARARLLAGMEEYLRTAQGQESGPASERAGATPTGEE